MKRSFNHHTLRSRILDQLVEGDVIPASDRFGQSPKTKSGQPPPITKFSPELIELVHAISRVAEQQNFPDRVDGIMRLMLRAANSEGASRQELVQHLERLIANITANR